MGRHFEINVRFRGGMGKLAELVKDWPERMSHVAPQLAYLSADFLRRYVRAKLPKGQNYRAYRSGLEVARVKGLQKGEYAYAVHIDMKNRLVKKVRPRKVLLEIHPKKRATRTNPEVAILEKYNPWTYDSLPFTPDPRFAFVVTKKVRPKQVSAVTEKRKRDRNKWSKELARVGVREVTKSNRVKIPKNVTFLPDLALEALKLEFGMGGTKPKPAWRTGVSSLARGGFRAFSQNPQFFGLPFVRPSYKLWRKWPSKTRHTINTVEARKYIAFQKKLGIHI